MEAELENAFLPEHTLKIAKKHREYGINTQWKMYSKVEHGFFSQLTRPVQLEAFEDFCDFADGLLNTQF